MPNKEIPLLPAAQQLDGSELLHGVQVGDSRRMSSEAISAFGRTWFIFKSRTTTAQPASPAEGDTYIIPTSATGAAWSTQDGKIGEFRNGTWEFKASKEGMAGFVLDTNAKIVHDGAGWVDLLPPLSLLVSFLPKPTANETLLFYTFVEPVTFPANFAASFGDPGINATATTTFTVYKNPTFTGDVITGGTVIGTVEYSTAGAYTFATTGGAAFSFAAGDSIGVKAQASPDATASGSFTLKAARTG